MGWLVFLVGGCAIILEIPGPNTAVTFAVLLATVVMSLLVTAVVMAFRALPPFRQAAMVLR
ncbi:hypothetical protein [Nonomuraea rhizosphaerae]|uniref:hypothetical protein n=1 Tax=Nonomuraea rhizosphaerae TaxID=2665663 RepID=UPI001C5DD256|nr:hypothetical protein [Nonomuraea rhizosphaerae]